MELTKQALSSVVLGLPDADAFWLVLTSWRTSRWHHSHYLYLALRLHLNHLMLTSTSPAFLVWLDPLCLLLPRQKFNITALIQVVLHSVTEWSVLLWFLLCDGRVFLQLSLLFTAMENSRSLMRLALRTPLLSWSWLLSVWLVTILVSNHQNTHLILKPLS